MKSIYQTNFKNQKVLVRVDFNVPLNSEKIVTDNSRIIAAKKTIDKILNDGGTKQDLRLGVSMVDLGLHI